MRALITGASGFVGGHLCALLEARGDVVVRASRDALGRLPLAAIDVVFHLAGSREPAEVQAANVDATVNVLDQTREIRTIVVGSSAMYGGSPTPLEETAASAPVGPYGVSKARADALAAARTDQPVLRARPFNIIGPGQRGDYVAARCAQQLVAIDRGAPAILRLGNLDGIRDFIDVRDVATGLVAIAERGEVGEPYNICTGVPTRARDVVDAMIQLIGRAVAVETKAAQATDVPYQVGSNAKLAALGWGPRYKLADTVRHILAEAQS